MTVLNFPDTSGKPTDGSFIYVANNVIYTWDGDKWTSEGQGSNPPDVRTGNLQEVTDLGNTTTNGITAAGRIEADYFQTQKDNAHLMYLGISGSEPIMIYDGEAPRNQTVSIRNNGDVVLEGSITAAGTLFLGDMQNGSANRIYSTGYIYTRQDDSSQAGYRLYSGGFGANDVVAEIKADGSITAAGDVNAASYLSRGQVYVGYGTGAGLLRCQQNTAGNNAFVVEDSNSNFTFAITGGGSVTAAGDIKGGPNQNASINDDGIWLGQEGYLKLFHSTSQAHPWFQCFKSDGAGSYTKPIEFFDDGSITAAGDANIGFGSLSSAGTGVFVSGNSGKINLYSDNGTGGTGNYFLAGYSGSAPKPLAFSIDYAGSAVFTGTVTANGSVLTRANGTTLDVGERLEKVDTALTNLKAALADASDFASLKCAIASALAEI